jgi:NitT/TauT family transport system ATP-binding protein
MNETAEIVEHMPYQRANSNSTLLQISGVSKTFDGVDSNLHAIDNIDLNVAQGEFLVILGPSGCGKSTLLNLIAGFDTPSQGNITIEGRPIRGPGPDRQVMFQEHALFPWLNVIDNVCFGLRNQRQHSSKARIDIARRMLATVHLEGFENSYLHELSGGMKHRVALARALAPNPALLLIDEPFPALDLVTKHRLWEVLECATATIQKTVVHVTHDPREAVFLGDRIVMMSPRPARIKEELIVDLPRPRNATDPEITRLATVVGEKLGLNQNEQ